MKTPFLKKISGKQIPVESGIFLALVLLILAFTILSPYFFTTQNFSNILIQSAITIVIASGATLVIASGGIDLSVGSVLCLSGILMAMSVKAGLPAWLSILLGLSAGVLMGAVNGFLIGVVKITPLIATLASLSVIRALAYIITDARPIYGFPMSIRVFGTGYLGPIPYAFILAVVVALLLLLVIKRTRIGRYTLAIGGNEEAARLSGVNIWKTKIVIYALAGLCAAVASLILTARLNAAEALAGSGMEMEAIAAAVIGGASLAGGVASIPGTIIGAILMATLKNGLTLMSVQPYFQQLTIGIVIVAAVFIDKIRKR
ncbi:MAG: ABC transporter permease [Anaerolineaceae bacterium]|jgi:ribose/xylose/arabinose/galactoside ABC-type transport system permease subunit|nr:ABC transporter permease [Anaerolineaceae bacterium]